MWNPFAAMGVVAGRQLEIVRGRGSTVWDADGNAYIDATASLWYCNVGHGRAGLAEATAAQMRELAAFHTFEFFTNPPARALSARLASLVPMDDVRVFFTSGGGSDAVDTAAKLARAYWTAVGHPEKRHIVSRVNAYHGMNAYGTALTGIPTLTAVWDPLVAPVERIPWDDAAALEGAIDRVGADSVAAFFCEPVIGAGGVLAPPDGYLDAVRRICREREVLFVADEVVCGFGRTGEWFASGRFSLDPDLMTVAKGLTSGYAPLGAVVASGRVAEPFFRADATAVFRHGYTYSGHPTSCAVAMANLDLIEREGLIERVRSLEPILERILEPLADLPIVSEVRAGVGLLAAVEVSAEARADRPDLVPAVVKAARQRGVLTRALRGEALQVSPPFVITEAELDRVASVFADALTSVG
jgi:adenosylmethionine-8-amino-7-oxononanoate aminotransferase